MRKIRINELARQLEVPSHEILDMLPGLGVTEKKTHSSSIDDDVADKIRRRVSPNGVAVAEAPRDRDDAWSVSDDDLEETETEAAEAEEEVAPEQEAPVVEQRRPAP